MPEIRSVVTTEDIYRFCPQFNYKAAANKWLNTKTDHGCY